MDESSKVSVDMPERPILKALKACAEWLRYCKEVGWKPEQLDKLEKLWWEHHNNYGNLTVAAPQPPNELAELERKKALLALYQRAFKEVQNFITLACNGHSDMSNAKYCWTLMKNAHDATKNSYDISAYLQHLPSCSALVPTISDKRGYTRSCNCGLRERTGLL